MSPVRLVGAAYVAACRLWAWTLDRNRPTEQLPRREMIFRRGSLLLGFSAALTAYVGFRAGWPDLLVRAITGLAYAALIAFVLHLATWRRWGRARYASRR